MANRKKRPTFYKMKRSPQWDRSYNESRQSSGADNPLVPIIAAMAVYATGRCREWWRNRKKPTLTPEEAKIKGKVELNKTIAKIRHQQRRT